MKILLSIKPEFAEKIFEGEKRFEFRKNVFKDSSVKTVVVYVTKPVGRIWGEFEIKGVEAGSPEEVWERTSEYAGISKKLFDEYFSGRDKAFAFVIGKVLRYLEDLAPKDVIDNFTPPQSFMYLSDDLSRMTAGMSDLFA